MKKVLIVFGTRPEAIKMAPLIKEFQKNKDYFETKICVTAQHRKMLDQVLDAFEIQPDYDLNLMKAGQDLYDITSRVLLEMRDVLKKEIPDLVLVHGDTTTSTATALAAFYQQIPVGHVEAGLRTKDIYSPWPEEMNRQITSRLTTIHFAPTSKSKDNLLEEGVPDDNIIVTGNTVIDALLSVTEKIKKDKEIRLQLKKELLSTKITIKQNRKLILVTGHRRENFGNGFLNICKALKSIAVKNPSVDIVYPVHLNPKVQNPVYEILGGVNNIFLTEPLGYLPFVYLMVKSHIMITDSGGIQEEAPSIGKPVLVMRETTERPEAVDAGTIKLVGTDTKNIIKQTQKLLDDKNMYKKMSKAHNPYGDGKSSLRIVSILIERINEF
jgi:UDP-N-acetylglucosamine 2-epimerase (non-hydrolysing)